MQTVQLVSATRVWTVPFYFSNAEITSSFSLCLENLKDDSRIFWKDIVNWIKENILSLYLVLKVDKMVRKYFDT